MEGEKQPPSTVLVPTHVSRSPDEPVLQQPVNDRSGVYQIHKKSCKLPDRSVSGVVISEKQSLNSLPHDGPMYQVNADGEH